MFLVSAFVIILSSFLILSLLSGKTKQTFGFIYLSLIAFSQIIFSCELLSVFKIITKNNFLICNFVFLIVSTMFFIKSKSKFYVPDIKSELKKVINALKRDKLLFVCVVRFAVFLISCIIKIFFDKVTFGDALSYYFTRSLHWIMNGTFNHFVTPDSRAIIMPINFDILYMLHFLFFKTEKGIAICSFIGYLFTLNVLYLFIRELFVSTRRALWSVFVFSALALVVIECITPVSDLTVGGLLLNSVFLFLISLKRDDKIALYFSSLSFALAIGIKTTAIMCIPSLLFVFCYLLFNHKLLPVKKIATGFIFFFFINFILFSSYNYILNYADFANPIANVEHILLNASIGGFSGFFCNFVKYCFMIFDTSGINTGYFCGFIMHLQSLFLSIFGLTEASYTSFRFQGYFDFNSNMTVNSALLGVVGLFAFLPSVIKSFKRKKKKIIKVLTLCLFINICILSLSMVFTSFNNRYLFTFVVLSSPIILYSYTKKVSFCKILTVFLILWYFSFNLASFIKASHNNFSEEQIIYEQLKNLGGKNIGLTLNNTQTQVFYCVKPVLNADKVYYIIPEIIDTYDLTEYDYIISDKRDISSDFVVGNHKIIMPNNKCDYIDAEGNLTSTYGKNIPVSVVCDNPVAYFIENGFNVVFETRTFVLLNKN